MSPFPPRAYSFESDRDLDGLQAALGAREEISWRGGDSEDWGEYWVGRLRDGSSKIRIFVDRGRFVLDISHVPELAGTMPFDEIRELVEHDLLPAIGARDIRPHPGWEG